MNELKLSLHDESMLFVGGGLFLKPTVSNSFVSSISVAISKTSILFPKLRCSNNHRRSVMFLSVSLSVKESEQAKEEGDDEEEKMMMKDEEVKIRVRGRGVMNTTKHLWAGAVADGFKLEYIVRGERMHLFGLAKKIAATQGLKESISLNCLAMKKQRTSRGLSLVLPLALLLLYCAYQWTRSERRWSHPEVKH